MEYLESLVEKRLKTIHADIASESFSSEEELNEEIKRVSNLMITSAVMKGIDSKTAEEYLTVNFLPKIRETIVIEEPKNYAFKEIHDIINTLIQEGNREEAKATLDDLNNRLSDTEIVESSIEEGLFTQYDVDYFKTVDYESLNKNIASSEKQETVNEEPKKGFLSRVKNKMIFALKRKSPYDHQNVELEETEEVVEEESKFDRFKDWCKQHKRSIKALGLAALVGGGILIGSHLHKQSEEPIEQPSISNEKPEEKEKTEKIIMTTFEVDEFHNFNANDEQTHIENVQLLARAFQERGIPVVSEEECMRLSREGRLAVSPEQLDNWYISINLEDINDLTFTKLMANTNTDKEKLSSDFLHVSNLLGSIYTTKEDTPFIYQFIANKEYSAHIKSYEEAIIQNQKGNKQDLIDLIMVRVNRPVAQTSSGAIGLLTTSLIYQQANVYNDRVISQDVMNLYNINNTCETNVTTFFSSSWAEYMRKVNSKIEVAITYTGSEKEAYEQYLKTLADEQDDNKIFIEKQVLLYMEKENIPLGNWDLIDNIANDREISYEKASENAPVEVKQATKKKIVYKEPTTQAELKVKQQVEAENAKKDQESFEQTINDYAKDHNAEVSKKPNGDIVIKEPGKQEIIVDGSTLGTYDPSKDYQGPIYDNYEDYKNDHKEEVEYVPEVGNVVVTDKEVVITNPNVTQDNKGNIIDKNTGDKIITGTEEEIDQYLKDHPETGKWETVEEGEIHYSNPDNSIPNQSSNKTSSTGLNEVPAGVEENIYNSLTPEEQQELNDLLNAGKEPIPGEIVSETYEPVEPYSLSNDEPEAYSMDEETPAEPVAETERVSDLAAQKAALEAARSDLVGESTIESSEKTF